MSLTLRIPRDSFGGRLEWISVSKAGRCKTDSHSGNGLATNRTPGEHHRLRGAGTNARIL